MRLQVSKTKNAASFYVVKSVYLDGKRTNKVVEKLGTYEELKEKLGYKDTYEWAEEYVKNLNRLEKENKQPDVIAKYSPIKLIETIPFLLSLVPSGGYLSFFVSLYNAFF